MFSHDFTDVTLVHIDNIDSHAHRIILTSDSPKKYTYTSTDFCKSLSYK